MRNILLTIIFLFIFFTTANAAVLRLDSANTNNVASPIFVDVVVDTDNRLINSIDVVIDYPADKLTFNGYQDGVVKFWIEPPHSEEGKIRLVGGIPGGVDRSYGEGDGSLKIVTLVFKASGTGSAPLSIERSSILLNDGRGTILAHEKIGSTINVGSSGNTFAADTNPPEKFTPVYVAANSTTATPALVTFSTYDRESAIRGYFVKSGLVGWKEAMSPYEINRGIFSKKINIKAVDIYGNETKSFVKIPGIVPGPIILVAILLIVAGIYRFFMVKKKI